jgi:hypothetical protein
MTIRAAIYARTSPDCPVSADQQVEHLKTFAAERGWTVAQVFIDRPATAKKDRRSGEVGLLHAIRSGAIDKVLVWSIDRIGRSLADLVAFIARTSNVALARSKLVRHLVYTVLVLSLAGCGGGKSAGSLSITCTGGTQLVGAASIDVLGDLSDGHPRIEFPDPANPGKTGTITVQPHDHCKVSPA